MGIELNGAVQLEEFSPTAPPLPEDSTEINAAVDCVMCGISTTTSRCESCATVLCAGCWHEGCLCLNADAESSEDSDEEEVVRALEIDLQEPEDADPVTPVPHQFSSDLNVSSAGGNTLSSKDVEAFKNLMQARHELLMSNFAIPDQQARCLSDCFDSERATFSSN